MASTVITLVDCWTMHGKPDALQHVTSNILWLADVQYSGASKTLWRRSIMRFDLTPADGLDLTNATLTRDITVLLGGGGHTMLFSRVLDPDTVGNDPCWIDQDHSESDVWDDVGGDFDHTGPPAGLSITEPTSTGIHVITDAGLLTLVEDARDNRANILMLLVYLNSENPGSNTGTHWDAATLTLTSPDCWALSLSVHRGSGNVPTASAPNCASNYDDGTTVDLTASPAPGWRVAHWHGTNNDNSTSITNTVTMNADRSVSVHYAPVTPTAHRDIVVLHDRARRPAGPRLPGRPRLARSPRRPRP